MAEEKEVVLMKGNEAIAHAARDYRYAGGSG